MINKELLSEVLSKDIIEYSIHTGFVWFKYKDYSSNINIYELANKCKAWAYTKGYNIFSYRPVVFDDNGNPVINYWFVCYVLKIDLTDKDNPEKQMLNCNALGKSEPEAIFKACEWVLKEGENK